MTKQQFYNLIKSKTVILDGATGTELQKNGMPTGVSPEEWILDNSDVIKKIQKEYVEAGSDIIYAPTFGANRVKLKGSKLSSNLVDANIRLVDLTRSVANGKLVAGNISAVGLLIDMSASFSECVDIYKEQVEALVKAEVDLLVIETMIDIAESRAAVIAAKEVCDLPIICTLTFDENMRSVGGTDALGALIIMQNEGVDAFGTNCGTGPDSILKLVEYIAPYSTIPIIAKPNAGMPIKQADGSVVFNMNSDEFASYAKRIVEAGADIIGGCCGTDAIYIEKTVKAVGVKKANINKKDDMKVLASPTSVCFFRDNLKISDPIDLNSDNATIIDKLFEVIDSFDVIKLTVNGECDIEGIMAELSLYANKPFLFDIKDENLLNRAKKAYNGKATW